MFKSANQNFILIPYDKLIKMIKYKGENIGITVLTNNESYTSGCSFLDNEYIGKESYDKSRRIVRGLFKSNKGILINSDVNGAYNILKKAFPEAFKVDEIEDVHLHPIRVSMLYAPLTSELIRIPLFDLNNPLSILLLLSYDSLPMYSLSIKLHPLV
jgi:hypothetical protein